MVERILKVKTKIPYDIVFARGGLHRLGEWCAQKFAPQARAMLVCDSNTKELFAKAAQASLLRAELRPALFSFPAGERSKRLSTIADLYAALAENGFTRTDFIVALGGGVTGDMAGFAAATYLRGIPFVQVPTSLLAQVDSSVGGKTGVDLPQGKNLVGAFHQPALVVVDADLLATLPQRWIMDGMGEVIKYGCIQDRALFGALKTPDSLKKQIEDVIFRCVDIKRALVEADEFDRGERMLLNFGHTFGHSIEKLQGFTGLSHGAAVGVGMVLAARMGEAAGVTKAGTAEELCEVLRLYGLPTEVDLNLSELLATTMLDKKCAGAEINVVLLRELGDAFICRKAHADFAQMAEALR